MFADENLRGEDREFGRTALGNEHDVEQGICDAGFRRDWDPARDVAAIRDDHIVEIELEAFSVIECDGRRVTAQFSKCRRGATQISERSPRSLHFGRELFVHHAAESTGRNIHKIADAITSDADKIDGPGPTGNDLFEGRVQDARHPERPRKIVARPKGNTARAALQPVWAIPFTTSFRVPSPPADTITSKSDASRANFSASPGCWLMQKRSASRRRNRSWVAATFFTAPAIGLRMTQVRIARIDRINRIYMIGFPESCTILLIGLSSGSDFELASPVDLVVDKRPAWQKTHQNHRTVATRFRKVR